MDQTIIVRPTTTADAETVTQVLSASYAELFRGWYAEDLLVAVLPLVSRPHPELLECGTYYIAENQTGSAMAVGGWTPDPPPAPDIALERNGPDGRAIREDNCGYGHIRHFATHPEHLRKGAARAILDTCTQQARAAGLTRMMCRSSLPGEAFYAALGFQPITTIETELANGLGLPSILMHRPLG